VSSCGSASYSYCNSFAAQQRFFVHTQIPSVITPSQHSLQPIHFVDPLQFANEPSPQAMPLAHQPQTSATPSPQRNSKESPPSRSSIFTTSGSVVTTKLRIAAASTRALPARAAHLSGWTHRLRRFARRRSAPAPAPSNLTQHTSYVAQHPVASRALTLTTSPLLALLPGAKKGRRCDHLTPVFIVIFEMLTHF
jgi:hypothetical protein